MSNVEKENYVYDAETIEPVKDENLVYDYEEEIKKREEDLDIHNPSDDPIPESSDNVFSCGLNGGKFILAHHCPMCGCTKRNITELNTQKRFQKEKEIAGYMSVCANCGHTDFYTDNPRALLRYMQGKA